MEQAPRGREREEQQELGQMAEHKGSQLAHAWVVSGPPQSDGPTASAPKDHDTGPLAHSESDHAAEEFIQPMSETAPEDDAFRAQVEREVSEATNRSPTIADELARIIRTEMWNDARSATFVYNDLVTNGKRPR